MTALELVGSLKLLSPAHGNKGFTTARVGVTTETNTEVGVLGEAGPTAAGRSRLLETLGVPGDARGIILLCGYVAAAVFGVVALITPPGDLIGWAYIAIALVGYWFIPTRGLTTFLWLLVAAGGVMVALGGSAAGWLECAIGILLAFVGALPGSRRWAPSLTPSQAVPRVDIVAIETPSPGIAANSNGEANDDRLAIEQLQIQTVGRFRLSEGGSDITTLLERKSSLSFLFKYLLGRWVLGVPEADRDVLADEFSPRIPQATQRERLRKQVHKLQRTTPPAIGSLVNANPTHVWLDLDNVHIDVVQLRQLRGRLGAKGTMPDPALAQEIRVALDHSTGEFLPGFEDLEQKVNGAGGSAGQIVANAREKVGDLKADLLIALAEYEDSIGQAALSIPQLKATLELLPHRQDVARTLIVAYLKTGQTVRASEVRRQFPAQE